MMVGYHNAIHERDDPAFATDSEATDEERRDVENQAAMHHQEYRHVTTHWDEHGCLEIRAGLTPVQGALVIKALEAAVEQVAQSQPAEKSESHELEVAKDPSAGAFPINNNCQYPRQRADALLTPIASSTVVTPNIDSTILQKYPVAAPSYLQM